MRMFCALVLFIVLMAAVILLPERPEVEASHETNNEQSLGVMHPGR